MEKSKFYNTVVKGDYCIGCGVCASVANKSVIMKTDEYGKMTPNFNFDNIDGSVLDKIEKVCPFSNESLNEDQIGEELYGKTGTYVDKLGFINSTYAGYVIERNYRDLGSSGGLGTWLVNHLLQEQIVDYVIHVGDRIPTKADNRLFEYRISKTENDVLKGAKSKYYPIELSGILKIVLKKPGNYVLVGVPCFIKSIRNLSKNNSLIKERIKYTVGLVCGHLKSSGFSEMLAWQVGVTPEELMKIDFRNKLKDYGANQYGITASRKFGDKQIDVDSGPVNEMYGTDWGTGMFKYKACDFCDDVTAETADITIGDAWLPEYVSDPKGTNIIIVRNIDFVEILKNAVGKGLIHLETVATDKVIESQSSGVFHRRDGLAYRLSETDKNEVWRPKKRVEPSDKLPNKIKKIQNLRVELYKQSHISFLNAKNNRSFEIFKQEMEPLMIRYKKLYKTSFLKRIRRKLKKTFNY